MSQFTRITDLEMMGVTVFPYVSGLFSPVENRLNLLSNATGVLDNKITAVSGMIGGDSAPLNASYIVFDYDATLSNERKLSIVTGDLLLTDSGANSTLQIGLVPTGIAGTYTKVIIDNRGRAVSGSLLTSGDLPSHTHALVDIDISGGTELNSLQGLVDYVPIYDNSATANRKTRPIDLTPGGQRANLIYYFDRAEIAAGWANNSTSGAGAGIQNAGNYVGANVGQIITLLAGSTTTGRAGRLSSTIACVFGTNPWHFETTVGFDILSDGTNTYTGRFGFIDSVSATPTDGAYFRYTNGTNGGRYQCVTVSNSVENAIDSGFTVDTSLNNFEIDVNSSATEVIFRINGNVVATSTGLIPSGTSRATGFGYYIQKSAGGTNRNLNYTYTLVYSPLSTPAI